jgi:hypothetical protein
MGFRRITVDPDIMGVFRASGLTVRPERMRSTSEAVG